MLNEVKRRGIAMSLSTVQRAEAAADERDQVETVTGGVGKKGGGQADMGVCLFLT